MTIRVVLIVLVFFSLFQNSNASNSINLFLNLNNCRKCNLNFLQEIDGYYRLKNYNLRLITGPGHSEAVKEYVSDVDFFRRHDNYSIDEDNFIYNKYSSFGFSIYEIYENDTLILSKSSDGKIIQQSKNYILGDNLFDKYRLEDKFLIDATIFHFSDDQNKLFYLNKNLNKLAYCTQDSNVYFDEKKIHDLLFYKIVKDSVSAKTAIDYMKVLDKIGIKSVSFEQAFVKNETIYLSATYNVPFKKNDTVKVEYFNFVIELDNYFSIKKCNFLTSYSDYYPSTNLEIASCDDKFIMHCNSMTKSDKRGRMKYIGQFTQLNDTILFQELFAPNLVDRSLSLVPSERRLAWITMHQSNILIYLRWLPIIIDGKKNKINYLFNKSETMKIANGYKLPIILSDMTPRYYSYYSKLNEDGSIVLVYEHLGSMFIEKRTQEFKVEYKKKLDVKRNSNFVSIGGRTFVYNTAPADKRTFFELYLINN